ncbi:hypothetical protein AVEN_266343-1 [Araneus ventricosus]|uniref:Uncharacterized protein n=1 Tax=Araneus ventricosus TaxID=182803 RepID=A0A4Y2CPU5_ARAVE|nr:hypothetical protein AVEN_266343-1 [Araneus ventricosus]
MQISRFAGGSPSSLTNIAATSVLEIGALYLRKSKSGCSIKTILTLTDGSIDASADMIQQIDLCFVIKRPTSPLQSEGRLDYSPYVYYLLHWSQICKIVHSQVCFVHLNREEKPYDKSDHVYESNMGLFQEVPLFQPP